MNDTVFTRVTGRVSPARRETCTLNGYDRVAVKDAPYPAAVPSVASQIVGSLVYLESLKELALLDKFESDLYKRITVTCTLIQDKGIRQVEADTYVWGEKFETLLLRDQPWSYEKFVSKGKMQSSKLYDP